MGYTSKAFMDTGSTLTIFPEDLYHSVVSKLCEGLDCSAYKGVYYLKDCKTHLATFKPLRFEVDEQLYDMPPQSYLYYYYNADGESMCEIALRSHPEGSEENRVIAGINFLENYLQLYNLEDP